MVYHRFGSILRLNDHILERVLRHSSLEIQVILAELCERIEDICIALWKINKKYHNNRLDVSYTRSQYFICKNAINFHTLKIFSSEFSAFNKATENMDLENLRKLQIILDSNLSDLPHAHFLKRCTSLFWITVSQEAMYAYMRDILELDTLSGCTIYHSRSDIDDLLHGIIAYKGADIQKLNACVERYPPKWLHKHNMEHCVNLEHLCLDTRKCKKVADWTKYTTLLDVPIIPHLKILYIFGENYCQLRLMRLILNCTNLETLVIDHVPNFTYGFWCQMSDLRERAGNLEPLVIYYHSLKNDEHLSSMEFI